MKTYKCWHCGKSTSRATKVPQLVAQKRWGWCDYCKKYYSNEKKRFLLSMD